MRNCQVSSLTISEHLKNISLIFVEKLAGEFMHWQGSLCTTHGHQCFFHNRTTIRKINRLHERCLHIICNDKQSSFKMLLEKDSSVSIHDRNIQWLATEMYKVSKGLSPPVVSNIFTKELSPVQSAT